MGKKIFSTYFILLLSIQLLLAQAGTGLNMKHARDNSNRSGIALGGIGTGSLELRKDGQFYHWSIMNNWPLFTGKPLLIRSFPHNSDHDSYLFFLVRYQVDGEKPQIKLLQINDGISEAGLEGISYYYPWMSAIEHIEYNGSFPFVSMKFTDKEMPFDITMQAFSPFVPHDVKNSSLPGVYFNFEIESHSDKPVDVFLIASLRNLTGYDEVNKYFLTEWIEGNGFNGFSMSCDGMDTTRSSWGQMGLFTTAPNHSHYLGWEHKHPYYEKLLVNPRFENINDTENRNMVLDGVKYARKAVNNDQRCFSSLGFDARLAKDETMKADVLLVWNFPNLYGAFAEKEELSCLDYSLNQRITKIQGHYYSNFFKTAGEVAAYMTSKREALYSASRSFFDHFYASDIDKVVLNQINSQFNTFISSSTLTKAGKFAIREGLSPSQQWGPN
ncbi:MAG: hypothetical protein JXR22_06760, partial [Prolixibacteraceae bacterium]|nr:hypothetical protein [Prolixibacteraceae bacterium]